jgi:DNA-directed RNA polymerase specialized sigma24 family protein
MKLFKLIASRAGQVLFDDRVEADSPREAREQMKTLLGLQSLTGVVYAITEIPVELIQSIVDAKLAEALQRVRSGQPPASIDSLIRPIASEAVREQLASLRTVQAVDAAESPPSPQRFDAFTSGEPATAPPAPRRRPRRPTADGRQIDWRAVKRLYLRCRSLKQTAAQFELSVNTVKARVRREGWGQ